MKEFKSLARSHWNVAGFLVTATTVLLLWSCQYPQNPANANTFPETRIANIPQNDTIAKYIGQGVFPEFDLYWLGDDPDGYVIGYKYRWTDIYRGVSVRNSPTTILNIASLAGAGLSNSIIVKGAPRSLPEMYRFFSTLSGVDAGLIVTIGDSLATRRTFAVPYKTGIVPGDSIAGADSAVHRSPTTGRFIFESPADSNMHRFEVSSIDNSGAEDPTPAVVNFWTLRSPNPIALIAGRLFTDGAFAVRQKTDRFIGLGFIFGSYDPSTFEVKFSWSVDDSLPTASWTPWSDDNIAYVTASDFKPIVTGTHAIYVRARNRWGVVSRITRGTFRAVVPPIDDPAYPKRILILNTNANGNGTLGRPSRDQINSFYRAMMDSIGKSGKYEIWNTASGPNPNIHTFPPRDTLARYTTILVLAESHRFSSGVASAQFSAPVQSTIIEYLSIGGNLIYSGTPDIRRTITPYNGWASEVFHIDITRSMFDPDTVDNDRDFVGAKTIAGSLYPPVPIDASKLPVDSAGAIRAIGVNYPRGFGQSISRFDSQRDDARYEDKPLGIRFIAPPAIPPARRTYSMVYFGFPLYYGETGAVIRSLRQAFTDVGE